MKYEKEGERGGEKRGKNICQVGMQPISEESKERNCGFSDNWESMHSGG